MELFAKILGSIVFILLSLIAVCTGIRFAIENLKDVKNRGLDIDCIAIFLGSILCVIIGIISFVVGVGIYFIN